MAEEPQLSSRSTEGKRKYEDQSPTPPSSARRTSGFSAPIASPDSNAAAPASYNNVPPPADEIQAAKQRAQEIAARLFSSAESKRSRLENGGTGTDDSNGEELISACCVSFRGFVMHFDRFVVYELKVLDLAIWFRDLIGNFLFQRLLGFHWLYLLCSFNWLGRFTEFRFCDFCRRKQALNLVFDSYSFCGLGCVF